MGGTACGAGPRRLSALHGRQDIWQPPFCRGLPFLSSTMCFQASLLCTHSVLKAGLSASLFRPCFAQPDVSLPPTPWARPGPPSGGSPHHCLGLVDLVEQTSVGLGKVLEQSVSWPAVTSNPSN